MFCCIKPIIPCSPPPSPSTRCKSNSQAKPIASSSLPDFNNGSQTHLPPTRNTYSSLIQSCINSQSFDAGRSIHGQMLAEGFVPDTYLMTKILMLYARSGDKDDIVVARSLFDEMTERNSTAWNTMILAYSRETDHKEVLRLFYQMLRDGAPPDKFTFPSMIKACIATSKQEAISQLQGLIIKVGLNRNVFVGGSLVDGYAGFGLMDDAVAAFHEVDGDNVIAWNSVLGGYVKLSLWEDAWSFFHQMLSAGSVPDHFTFATIIKACGSMRSLAKGKQVHSNLIVSGRESDAFVANSLIDMYASCDEEHSCRKAFDLMKEPNQVSWNSIISCYAHLGHYEEALHLFSMMTSSGHRFDRFNLSSSLLACAALNDIEIGRQIHGLLIRRSLDSDLILGTAVVDMYAKCGCTERALHAFDRLEEKSDVSWNALISGFVQEEDAEGALHVYHEMRLSISPDQFTLASLLSLAASRGRADMGKQVHGYIFRTGIEPNVVLETEMVHMYARCGRLGEAERIFHSMRQRNNYSWNFLIEGHEQNGDYSYALCLFYEMQLNGIKPDSFSMASALTACACLSNLNRGKQIHGFLIKNTMDNHRVLCGMLVDFYARCKAMNYAYGVYERVRVKDAYVNNVMISALLDCRRIDEARELFDQMGERTLVSWNMMIMGYSKYGFEDESFRLFFRMREEGVDYEPLTIVPLFNLCAGSSSVDLGEMLHTIVIKSGFSCSSLILDSAVIDMYSKCGLLEDARRYFDSMDDRNIVAWNSMMTGYGKHGETSKVFELYRQLKKFNVKPSGVTFLSLLSACSHSGMVEEGLDCFIAMLEEHEVEIHAEHYTCMVDLLGRAGFLEEAKQVIDEMPIEPEVSTWGALLGACRMHKEVRLGRQVAEKLFQLDSENSGHYILMANIYSSVAMWKEADQVRELMKSRGVKKEPGVSWIRIDNETHTFHAGDRNHPLADEIYTRLRDLTAKIERMGYVPNDEFVLRSVEDPMDYLIQHSERLAVGLGIIKLPERSIIRVFKNLRICGDCHVAIKLISEVTGRTIVVRDNNRFHHFKDGACSCGDYW
ncbi:Pentatricopeptide repeat-containing protein [Platanthera zijinensis]|uniref:Pentatricopeptide repeat-containing protein n=1 Tax=Platanthera zijinensis TaxID=2320716 RepID=A0AAP0B175_9ASPA